MPTTDPFDDSSFSGFVGHDGSDESIRAIRRHEYGSVPYSPATPTPIQTSEADRQTMDYLEKRQRDGDKTRLTEQ